MGGRRPDVGQLFATGRAPADATVVTWETPNSQDRYYARTLLVTADPRRGGGVASDAARGSGRVP
jgi:hypothetical protein